MQLIVIDYNNNNNNNNNDNTINNNNKIFYPGTFVQFGEPGFHKKNEQGIRSIKWIHNDSFWIANEDLNKIIIVNKNGILKNIIDIINPIDIFFYKKKNIVFISSKNNNNDNNKNNKHKNNQNNNLKTKNFGSVYGIHPKTLKTIKEYKLIGMKHPSSILAFNDILYVADQTSNSVYSFNITTERFIKVVINAKKFGVNFKGVLEHMEFSDC
jgi:hypothetical protein